MYKASLLIQVLAGVASAAEIRGTVQLTGKPAGPVQVCYEAVTTTGEKITNMAGATLGEGASSAWCDTYAPRRTELKWDPEKGLNFEHTNLPAGKYVVAVKNKNFLDWKTVELAKDSSVTNVALALDPQPAGKLRVQIANGVGDYEVVLVPVAGAGLGGLVSPATLRRRDEGRHGAIRRRETGPLSSQTQRRQEAQCWRRRLVGKAHRTRHRAGDD